MIVETEKYKYKLIVNEGNGFDLDEFLKKYTSFFEIYDYVVGDIAYSKLRLKGFNKNGNKNLNKINDYKNFEKYIKENCAYNCKYFVLEKITE